MERPACMTRAVRAAPLHLPPAAGREATGTRGTHARPHRWKGCRARRATAGSSGRSANPVSPVPLVNHRRALRRPTRGPEGTGSPYAWPVPPGAAGGAPPIGPLGSAGGAFRSPQVHHRSRYHTSPQAGRSACCQECWRLVRSGLLSELGQRLGAEGASGDLPLVGLLTQDSADEADDGGRVRDDADDVGAALDFLCVSEALAGRGTDHRKPARAQDGPTAPTHPQTAASPVQRIPASDAPWCPPVRLQRRKPGTRDRLGDRPPPVPRWFPAGQQTPWRPCWPQTDHRPASACRLHPHE